MLDLSKPWTELPLVVFDFETTGVDPVTCAPVEVAVVRFEGGRIVDRYSTMLKPEISIPPEATAIHGITDEMVDDAPILEEVACELAAIARDAVPVAFNAPYDRTILHRFITGSDVPAFDPKVTWLDVYVIVASPRVDKYVKGSGRLKLTNVCKRWNVAQPDAHRALGDAMATGALLFRLLEAGAIKSCTLGKLLEHMQVMREEQDADRAQYRQRLRAEERLVWRGYAGAALTGGCPAPMAAQVADLLIEAEKDRFSGIKP